MTNCTVTYYDWAGENFPEDTAANMMLRTENMPCILEDGHDGPHKWGKTRKLKPWELVQEWNTSRGKGHDNF